MYKSSTGLIKNITNYKRVLVLLHLSTFMTRPISIITQSHYNSSFLSSSLSSIISSLPTSSFIRPCHCLITLVMILKTIKTDLGQKHLFRRTHISTMPLLSTAFLMNADCFIYLDFICIGRVEIDMALSYFIV